MSRPRSLIHRPRPPAAPLLAPGEVTPAPVTVTCCCRLRTRPEENPMTSVFFFDTEFHDPGHGEIELISVGMVDEGGREYYAVSSEFDWSAAWADEWLRVNVLSHLPTITGTSADGRVVLDHGHPAVKSRAQIRQELEEFTRPDDPHTIEMWAYCSGYDDVVVRRLWGRLIDSPPWWPWSSNDTRQEHQRLRGSVLPKQAHGEHNALADAHHTRVQYLALKAYEANILSHIVTNAAADAVADVASRFQPFDPATSFASRLTLNWLGVQLQTPADQPPPSRA